MKTGNIKDSGFLRPVFMMASFELVFLVIQFLVGMYVNLFVALPHSLSFLGMMGFMGVYSGFAFVMVHMMIGILVGLTSIGILFVSLFSGRFNMSILSISLLLSIILAGVNGLFFVFDGQNNINSYLMSIGFILAVIFDVMIISNSKQKISVSASGASVN
ncbi:MAG: hypothetical protein M1306_04980 [Candidatus Thermoplasmatota archaeon]|nr:hypothetical protein [Candidatus Thermoplasmatota archaeon]